MNDPYLVVVRLFFKADFSQLFLIPVQIIMNHAHSCADVTTSRDVDISGKGYKLKPFYSQSCVRVIF